MKALLSAKRFISVLVVLLLSLALIVVWGSKIRETAAINLHNLFVTRHIYTQDRSCVHNSGGVQQEIWLPADKFFENVNPLGDGFGDLNSDRYGAELFKRVTRQDGVNSYVSDALGEHYGFNDQQFRDLEALTSTSDASGNIPNSFIMLYWDKATVATTVDLAAGSYQLQLYGKNGTPGPVTLLVYINDTLLGSLIFDRDDESWEIKCLTLHPNYWPDSNKDRAKITVSFTGDGGPGGSRNGSFAWIRLVPISSF